jgi:hypothetical protein
MKSGNVPNEPKSIQKNKIPEKHAMDDAKMGFLVGIVIGLVVILVLGYLWTKWEKINHSMENG